MECGSVCVLVIEGELLVPAGLAGMLEEAGFEVLCAASGWEALELASLHRGRIIAVVTDYRMPGRLTGADVIAQMRCTYATIPMFMITATTSPVVEEVCRAHSVSLIGRPFDADRLVETLEEALAD